MSGIRHATHAIYVASWCRRIGEELGALLRLFDYDADRHDPRLRQRVRDIVSFGGITWAESPMTERPDFYVAVGPPGIKPWLRIGRGATVVSVDEGLSSYGDARSRLRAMRREGAALPTALVRVIGGLAAYRICDEGWRTYRWTGSRWEVNPCVVDEFHRRVTGPAGDPTAAVYLAQPWVRLGLMSAPDYRSHVARIQAACERGGLRLTVQPHHLEQPCVYDGFDVSIGAAPAEITKSILDAPIVIGEHSSALVNIAAFGTTVVRRVASPVEHVLDQALSARQRSLLDQYLPPAVHPDDLDLSR